jgi:polyisoprenoid-binding protein YceI
MKRFSPAGSAWIWPLFLVAAGCAKPVPEPVEPAGPQLPVAVYEDAARQGANVYRVDAEESRVLIRVGRDGRMKHLGHEHVIASENVEGLVMLHDDPEQSRADLLIPLELLVVDKPEYREQMGLEGEMTESAIDGTTTNMQDKVLESGVYPWVEVSARFKAAQPDAPMLDVSMTLHGMTASYEVPVEFQVEADQLVIHGEMTIQHADFGLTPYSAAGGLIKVAEELQLRFSLVAHQM